jgi:hypothetical protein
VQVLDDFSIDCEFYSVRHFAALKLALGLQALALVPKWFSLIIER